MDTPCIRVRTRRADGYAQRDGEYVHRSAWEAVHGPIPAGLVIDHLCKTRNCVNVSHMELVTPRENTLRGDGPSAINAKKERCPLGHEYETKPTGQRFCRECKRRTARERRAAYGRRDRGTWTGPTDMRKKQ